MANLVERMFLVKLFKDKIKMSKNLHKTQFHNAINQTR